MSTPGWLGLLRLARHCHGQPSMRTLATTAQISLSTVSNTLTGRTAPTIETLNALIEAIDCTFDEASQILDAFVGIHHTDPPARQPRTDTQLLAEAINNLAEAIRGLHPDRTHPEPPPRP